MPPASFMGLVTKCGAMNKTVTVTVSRTIVHKKTGKELLRTKKFLTHDENNTLRLDDSVLIRNCRPLSARKRFTLERIIKSPETERDEAHKRQAEQAKQPRADPVVS
ncbi:nucleic acid-binding protein [Trametopsis cervina]|nr:nucleic acid-binding protein [Trametopsis cervina]